MSALHELHRRGGVHVGSSVASASPGRRRLPPCLAARVPAGTQNRARAAALRRPIIAEIIAEIVTEESAREREEL